MSDTSQLDETCPMGMAIKALGGKWKLAIVWRLSRREARFNELQRLLGGVTHKILGQQLKEMEADGLVARQAYPESPPRVVYSLTETGRSLAPLLDAMCDWGRGYLECRNGFAKIAAG
jgi:DNA-binding HxlR family transcriptional regulator